MIDFTVRVIRMLPEAFQREIAETLAGMSNQELVRMQDFVREAERRVLAELQELGRRA